MFDLTAVLSVLHLPANAKRLNNTGKRIEFRGGAEIGVSVHASLNRPLLSFNIVWIDRSIHYCSPIKISALQMPLTSFFIVNKKSQAECSPLSNDSF